MYNNQTICTPYSEKMQRLALTVWYAPRLGHRIETLLDLANSTNGKTSDPPPAVAQGAIKRHIPRAGPIRHTTNSLLRSPARLHCPYRIFQSVNRPTHGVIPITEATSAVGYRPLAKDAINHYIEQEAISPSTNSVVIHHQDMSAEYVQQTNGMGR